VEVAREDQVPRLLCHSFSNNGGALYQQLVEVVAEEGGLQIAGAVFDSAPGPIHLMELAATLLGPGNTLGAYRRLGDLGIQRPLLQAAYWLVNTVNGLPLRERLREASQQRRALARTLPLHGKVPWVGPYLKYLDPHPWPTLFLASKKDAQIPWRYIASVAELQAGRGRDARLVLFPASGHVAHLKVHPELYQREVEAFLAKVQGQE